MSSCLTVKRFAQTVKVTIKAACKIVGLKYFIDSFEEKLDSIN